MAAYYYTVSEVADIFGVRITTVLDWIRDGELRTVRDWTFDRSDYHCYRIAEQAVEDFMTESLNRVSQLLAIAERKEREARIARMQYENEKNYWNQCFEGRIYRRIR